MPRLTEIANQISRTCKDLESNRDANEAISSQSALLLLEFLGAKHECISQQYKCDGNDKVDIVARFEPLASNPSFNVRPREPEIIIEVKKSAIEFAEEKSSYWNAISQLERYLKSRRCRNVRHGLIYNGKQVQLFKKHGRLIYPITNILSLSEGVINKTLELLSDLILGSDSKRGTIISVWNNKGGVGKTTTAQSLGLLLSTKINYGNTENNRVLLIDYDHNQGDLTSNFKKERSNGSTKALLEAMINKKLSRDIIESSIETFSYSQRRRGEFFKIDILVADEKLNERIIDYRTAFTAISDTPLRDLCLGLSRFYDYIIIDAPPNYETNIFSREAIQAADCILPIALFLDRNSTVNYAGAFSSHLRKAKSLRKDGGPYSLGIWFNRWRSNSAQERITRENVESMLLEAPQYSQVELRRVFFRQSTGQETLRRVVESPDVARSIMDSQGLAGVIRFVKAKNAYSNLLADFID